MAVVVTETNFPLAPLYPMPSGKYDRANYWFAARTTYDDATPQLPGGGRAAVLYFHGSGAAGFLSGPLLDGLLAKGYVFIQAMNLGAGASTPSPYRYGYGNVAAPHFMASFIKSAWWVESAVKAAGMDAGSVPWCLLGHSNGATAAVAWAAGLCSGRNSPAQFPATFKGIVANAATVAGLGNLSWNDMNRNINSMSALVNRLKTKAILSYGNLDTYAPPDYARRLQMAIPEGSTDTYMVTPGDLGHDWINNATYSPIVIAWVEQLLMGLPVTDKDGNPAIPGAISP